VTDFLPSCRQRFFSDFRWEDAGRLTTQIKGVKVVFPDRAVSPPTGAVLAWTGTDVVFKRTPEDFVLAFELFSRGDVAGGWARIRGESDAHRRIYPDLERRLNRLGYQSLRAEETPFALEVVYMNRELFPESSNVCDSYGEALTVGGRIHSA
jgi:hypothetical protein